MFNTKIRTKGKKVFGSYERARLVALISCAFSLIYHIGIFIFFLINKILPLAYYNIISISLFTLIIAFIPRMKNFIAPYMLAVLEVIFHQILADYYLGTEACFHFFILIVGLLPYLVFEDKFSISVPLTFITSCLFVIFENMTFEPIYNIDTVIIKTLRYTNISITVLIILFLILVYTVFVFQIEAYLKKQNDMLGKEIKLASSIQQNFYKQDVTKIKDWDIGFCYQPMTGVSGDLYDVFKTDDVLDGFGVFDVSGHGISSGLVTMLVKNIIHQEFYIDKDEELWETLLKINDRVIEEKGDIENYLTGILARIKDKNTIEFVNASHPLPLVYRKKTGDIEVIPRRTEALGAIGIKDFPTFYESQFINLEEGDELILYTDGAIECINSNSEEFGIERLKESLKNVVEFRASEQIYLILNDINDFRGSVDPKDDITLLIIKK